VYDLGMNPTLQSRFEEVRRSFVEDLTGLIRQAATEAAKSAISGLKPIKATPKTVKIRAKSDGNFEALVGDRLVKRSRRRDLVRYARNKGYSAT
jgi:hypothetical protein